MKNIVCIDCETTGLSSKDDYIIQLSAVKFDPKTFETLGERDWYVKPIHKYTIADGAFMAHGLTKEFIEENGRPITEVADEFLEFIEGCDFLGYNSNGFDIKMIYKDFQLVGKELPMDRMFYDSYFMDVKMNPRTLSALYTRTTGKTLEGAHNSLNDAKATIEIFQKQMEKLSYEEINTWNENKMFSPEGSIRIGNINGAKEDVILFNVGKYKDKEFVSVTAIDPSYVKWFLENIASEYTKKILREYCHKNSNLLKK